MELTEKSLSIRRGISWLAGYFLGLLCVTALDIGIWRTVFSAYEEWLNLAAMLLLNVIFLRFLLNSGYQLTLWTNITGRGVALSILCSLFFYIALDHGLDPLLETAFPGSEENYQETVDSLRQAPVTSFIQVCLIAPFMEEVLMRDYLLGGLRKRYGFVTALLLSAAVFALFHFNMVQTISAFFCGIVLGLLYKRTESVFCCILAHFGYNAISYLTYIL